MKAVTLPFKRLLCGLLAAVLLFAQSAIAGYACPGGGLPGGAPAQFGTAVEASAAQHPIGLDADAPGLCLSHCQSSQQKVDAASVLTVAPAALSEDYSTRSPPPPQPSAWRVAAAVATSGSPREPPHLILHCCRRD